MLLHLWLSITQYLISKPVGEILLDYNLVLYKMVLYHIPKFYKNSESALSEF